MRNLVIEMTDAQYEKIKKHLSENREQNQKEEKTAGYSFHLNCTEFGFSWLEVELNSKLDLGEVIWRVE